MSANVHFHSRFERRFYLCVALSFLALVFGTFARPYYLKWVFGTRPLPRGDVHKRLMLLTIACMLPSAVGRIPLDFIDNFIILLSLDVFVVTCLVIDTVRHRRLHPAFAWGGAVVLGALHLAFHMVMTPWWNAVGTAFVS